MKQVIVLRTDLGMSTGKLIAQACHASLGAYKNASSGARNEWEASGQTMVAVQIEGEDDLMKRFRQARAEDVPGYIVKDAGRTELEPGTVTALGLGPADDAAVDKVTKDLKLM